MILMNMKSISMATEFILACCECPASYVVGNPKPCQDGKFRCKKCQQRINNRKTKEYREERNRTIYRDRRRDWVLRKKYGITLEKYHEILAAQGGGCGICGVVPSKEHNLPVDHDHKTDLIRGILCQRCNRALGSIGDTVSAVGRVLTYLRGQNNE